MTECICNNWNAAQLSGFANYKTYIPEALCLNAKLFFFLVKEMEISALFTKDVESVLA